MKLVFDIEMIKLEIAVLGCNITVTPIYRGLDDIDSDIESVVNNFCKGDGVSSNTTTNFKHGVIAV